MKKIVFLLLLSGCGDTAVLQSAPYYQPNNFAKCRFYGAEYCGYFGWRYMVYGCNNGMTYHCLTQWQAFDLLNN